MSDLELMRIHGKSPAPGERNIQSELLGLAALFLKLGFTAFGGPAAHVALMEDEVVRRRSWLSREEFIDLLGATNLIPGPNSTELAIHIGYRRAGFWGLLVAGASFILPASALVTMLAWAYVRYSKLPEVEGILYGIKPAVIAVVAQAIWRLRTIVVTDKKLLLLGLASAALALYGVNELLIIFGAGAAVVVVRNSYSKNSQASRFFVLGSAGLPAAGMVTLPAQAGLATLFLFFLKVGAILFGSGYVLIAFLRADLVERWHWLAEGQLLDAVAVGQVTPGPLFSTATFVGYILNGPAGAFVATFGIFLPSFVYVAISGPLIPRLLRSKLARNLLDGINVGSVGLMAAVAVQLTTTAIVDWMTALLTLVSAGLLVRRSVNAAYVVLLGALVGVSRTYW